MSILFSLISIDETDEDTLIILQNPTIITVIRTDERYYMQIRPWIELSNDDIFIIRLDKVITMTESKDLKLIEIYNDYLAGDDTNNVDFNQPGKAIITEQMGYVSSVEEARKKLEDLYKDLKES